MSPFKILFLLFLAIPILEIYLLITVGGMIGVLPTIFLVVLTAVIGAILLRQQGFSIIQRAQQEMAAGQIPAMAILDGVFLLAAGALLLTPGFFTDVIGFLCLTPAFRRWTIQLLSRRIQFTNVTDESGFPPSSDHTKTYDPPGKTIEGDFKHRDNE